MIRTLIKLNVKRMCIAVIKKIHFNYLLLCLVWTAGFFHPAIGQSERPDQSLTQPTTTATWNGLYGKFRLGNRLYWDAQFHYRRVSSDDTPLVGRMGQIYNRHALNYQVNDRLAVALGGVLRLNFTPDPGNPAFEDMVLEPRVWHEYLFAMPFNIGMAYHRIRIEHRWNRSNDVGADWIFRNRWRYKFYMNIPLNNRKLIPGTFMFTPDVEIIMQSGKPVIDSPLEDFRVNPSIGYIHSPRLKYSVGMMYTTGQTLGAGYMYTSRWVLRTNIYLSLDFRKKQSRIPGVRLFD
ncbi:DUF2490 domain-containing protein [Sphingobacterium gobiense]|uniref:DUF2490 domain-containing protein n=1 Tax=Sphingobacterium gobiense TaxID=1382456 RepID=A0A2S9JID7_9SPHI|nr:DUF2490 domain-containing protein [Sphingobacterium gobiense]